jgi:hypothetical protein
MDWVWAFPANKLRARIGSPYRTQDSVICPGACLSARLVTHPGEVAEWSIASDLKSDEPKGSVSSNLTLSVDYLYI